MIIQGTSPTVEIYTAVLTVLEAIEADEKLDASLDGLSLREHQQGVAAGLRRIADQIEADLDDEEETSDDEN